MAEKNLSLLSREICAEAGVELDQDGLDKLRVVTDRAGAIWPDGAIEILKEKNQPLLERLFALESHLNSLLLLPVKPPALNKEFKVKLEEYEKTIQMCAEYANRHITK